MFIVGDSMIMLIFAPQKRTQSANIINTLKKQLTHHEEVRLRPLRLRV